MMLCRNQRRLALTLLTISLTMVQVVQSQEAAEVTPVISNTEAPVPDSRCDSSRQSFELITGQVYSSSMADTLATVPDSLQLTDCLDKCQADERCQSVNFETGLCVLFNSSASGSGSGLKPSQFPVFTIYAQKVCLSVEAKTRCPRPWAFERVLGHELRDQSRKQVVLEDRLQCMDACLLETTFNCRSFNFDSKTNECSLSDMDRHALSEPGKASGTRYFRPASVATVSYFESNCVSEPNALCDFKPLKGKVMKTVDSIYEGITTDKECRLKCLEADYRCFSYDLGDPNNKICRTSHLDSSSLTHIKEAYFDTKGSTTFELASCFNVTIECGAKNMKAVIQTNRIFGGKVYDKTKPNSCVNDVKSTLEFSLDMNYNDISCDVKQLEAGVFSNLIVIQHHDLIVKSSDIGLNINCHYNLTNQSISNDVVFAEDGDLPTGLVHDSQVVHSTMVAAPNITILISDSEGNDITQARVGDLLKLKFVITDEDSPYGIFVRDLVALDGSDTNEIVLIDENGCPTDPEILAAINATSSPQAIETVFEAFKFPTSNLVQFKAIVSPCVTSCQPAVCGEYVSYGRRKRSSKMAVDEEEKVVVVKTLRIDEKFVNSPSSIRVLDSDIYDMPLADCYDFKLLSIVISAFVLVQIVVIVTWIYGYQRRDRKSMAYDNQTFSDMYSVRSIASLSPTDMAKTWGKGHPVYMGHGQE
ncbi:hypothetical protein HDE_09128 [Halotydeus destructor]|nr:hypothetical protein HDE_09128 [Halotydeus destructor]